MNASEVVTVAQNMTRAELVAYRDQLQAASVLSFVEWNRLGFLLRALPK